MLTWARRIAIFLLLGAILNIAVAWGIALAIQEGSGNSWHDANAKEIRWWQNNAPAGYEPLPGQVVPMDAIACSWDVIYGASWSKKGGPQQYASRVRSGLPLRCFEAQWWHDYTDAPLPRSTAATIERGVWVVLRSNVRESYIPIGPIWLGLVLNSLLYAGVASVVVWIPCWYRRRRRVRRRLCPACAYPMGTSAVCTECGAPLPDVVAK